MGEIRVGQIDDAMLGRLDELARTRRTSVEALAREMLKRGAVEASREPPPMLTREEKIALVERMQATVRAAMVPGVPQTPSLDLIREDRDR